MKCERDVEKKSVIGCDGKFCESDGSDAARIAQNFSLEELNSRIDRTENQLRDKPESCDLQAAFNQMMMALQFKGGNRGLSN